MLSRVGKMLPGISGGGLFGAGYPGGQLLGGETAGLAIDFTAPNNRLLIRNTSALTNFVGNVFVNDGGPVSFSRASLGTVVDSDGKVKWAAHNLLLASEQFDAASWVKTTTTVAANSVVAPNSTTTAETLTAGGANSTALQSYSASAVAYTFGVWLRRKTGTGTIQIAADSGTWNTVTITADWALYTITQTPAAGTISAGIRIVTSGDEVYAWGAHLYRSDLGGMQANASAYPMYNPTTPKNLLGFTETFSTGWTATNATRAASTEANPNGLSVCSELTATAGNGTLLGSLSLLASPYTFSIWLKRKTGTGDIQITVDGSTYVTVAVTEGWQRFSTTLTPTAGTRTPGIRIVTNGDAVFHWGAQLSDSASLDPYIANTGAAPAAGPNYGPRLDYDPSTLAAKGLLVEEQRTNLLVYSEQIDNAAWTKVSCTVTANAVASPDGTTDADQLTVTTAGLGLIAETATVTASATNDYYFSAFVKAGNVSVVTLNPYYIGNTESNVYFNLSTLVVVGAPYAGEYIIQAYGNGWYRVGCRIARDATATRTTIAARIWVGSRPSASVGDYVYVWGAQLEAGSFATSYIPTGAATATRAVDVASVSTLAFPYSESNGTWVAAFQTQYSGTAPFTAHLINYDGSGSKRVLYFGAGSDVIGSFDGTTILNATGDVTGSVAKSASAYTAAERAVVSNGGTVTTGSTVAGYSSASIAYLGSNSSVSLNGWVRQITYLPRRITNADLQARSA